MSNLNEASKLPDPNRRRRRIEPISLCEWMDTNRTSHQATERASMQLDKSIPNYVVIDDLFLTHKLDLVLGDLLQQQCWQLQRHTYSKLYVDNAVWQNTELEQTFCSA